MAERPAAAPEETQTADTQARKPLSTEQVSTEDTPGIDADSQLPGAPESPSDVVPEVDATPVVSPEALGVPEEDGRPHAELGASADAMSGEVAQDEQQAAPAVLPVTSPDASADLSTEVLPEASSNDLPEESPEASQDTPLEASTDVSTAAAAEPSTAVFPEASQSATPEASPDVSAAASPEPSTAAYPEASQDAPPEASPDASTAASPEASQDAPPEASLDVSTAASPEPSSAAYPEASPAASTAASLDATSTAASPEATRKPPSSGTKAAKGRAALWRKILLGKDASKVTARSFSEWDGELTEQNQRVIRADCERTRADEPFFRQPEIRKKMEAMLTCWCQYQSVRYKQGLNEVLAPFIFLQTEPDGAAPSDDEVFACFTAFLRRFAPLFESEDFVPLQCAFVFFRRLLLYHYPDLHHLLIDSGISPEMFCTPWFLTVFASKTPLRITLQLWDRHLERNEPSFFVFLAVAVLGSSQQAVHQAERSALPEILTSLGISSRSELERLWSAAEDVHRITPATFAARLRRTVLGVRQARKGKGDKEGSNNGDRREAPAADFADERLLERVEEEKCFFILPEELVGHCYPPRSGEERKPWHPSPMHTWRLIVLDLRSQAEFEAARLPTALPFDALALPMVQSQSLQSPWSIQRRLLNWGQESSGLDPARVFEALKGTLGEDWVCNREAHICLLGSSEPERATLVRSLYEILTAQLSLRHVSVASGGFEAVAACVKKNGFELVLMDESSDMAGGDSGGHSEGGRWSMKWSVAATAAAAHAGSAWSSLKKAATAATAKAGESVNAGAETNDVMSDEGAQMAGAQNSAGFLSGDTTSGGAPALRDRPGNWPSDIDLGILPRRLCGELCVPNFHWPCIAMAVQCPASVAPKKSVAADTALEGCSSLLAMVGPHLVCAADPRGSTEEVVIFAEYSLSKVLRVTSKKQAPDTLIFYFKTGNMGSTSAEINSAESSGDPSMVLCFTRGAADVKSFIKALRGGYNHTAALPAAGIGSYTGGAVQGSASAGADKGATLRAEGSASAAAQTVSHGQADQAPATSDIGSNGRFAPPPRPASGMPGSASSGSVS